MERKLNLSSHFGYKITPEISQTGNDFGPKLEGKLNLNESSLEISSWARSSAWLERSTDNRKVMCSNHIGPIFQLF